jgi:hypothetical protein
MSASTNVISLISFEGGNFNRPASSQGQAQAENGEKVAERIAPVNKSQTNLPYIK